MIKISSCRYKVTLIKGVKNWSEGCFTWNRIPIEGTCLQKWVTGYPQWPRHGWTSKNPSQFKLGQTLPWSWKWNWCSAVFCNQCLGRGIPIKSIKTPKPYFWENLFQTQSKIRNFHINQPKPLKGRNWKKNPFCCNLKHFFCPFLHKTTIFITLGTGLNSWTFINPINLCYLGSRMPRQIHQYVTKTR